MLSSGALLQAVEERLSLFWCLGPGRAALGEIAFRLSHSRLYIRVMEPALIFGKSRAPLRVEREKGGAGSQRRFLSISRTACSKGIAVSPLALEWS